MKQVSYLFLAGLIFSLLVGCSASALLPGAELVELVNVAPDKSKCEFLGEVVGSQGNWFTGDITSNEDLMIGARNDLRNKAYKLGGNIVFVVALENSSGWDSIGNDNTTVVGKVYRCTK